MVDWSHVIQEENEIFENPTRTRPKGFLDILKWIAFEKRTAWPAWVDSEISAEVKKSVKPGEIHTVMINHATVLIQTSEANILTDPVFSERTSPVSWAGPKRRRSPGLKIKDLPPIDLVLVSHNHYDHMDLSSLVEIWKKFDPHFVLPLRNFHFLFEAGIYTSKVSELNWWEKFTFKKDLQIFLTPAQHWSARGTRDRNRSLWGGFWIEVGEPKQRIFFAGDTGYADHFLSIQKKWGNPDLSFLPIGAYEPRWFMKDQHMNPEEAVQAHLDLKSEKSVAIHWGTWPLTDEGMRDPVLHLKEALTKLSVPTERFVILENGEHLAVSL